MCGWVGVSLLLIFVWGVVGLFSFCFLVVGFVFCGGLSLFWGLFWCCSGSVLFEGVLVLVSCLFGSCLS